MRWFLFRLLKLLVFDKLAFRLKREQRSGRLAQPSCDLSRTSLQLTGSGIVAASRACLGLIVKCITSGEQWEYSQ